MDVALTFEEQYNHQLDKNAYAIQSAKYYQQQHILTQEQLTNILNAKDARSKAKIIKDNLRSKIREEKKNYENDVKAEMKILENLNNPLLIQSPSKLLGSKHLLYGYSESQSPEEEQKTGEIQQRESYPRVSAFKTPQKGKAGGKVPISSITSLRQILNQLPPEKKHILDIIKGPASIPILIRDITENLTNPAYQEVINTLRDHFYLDLPTEELYEIQPFLDRYHISYNNEGLGSSQYQPEEESSYEESKTMEEER